MEIRKWEVMAAGRDLGDALACGYLWYDQHGRLERIWGTELRAIFTGTRREVKIFCLESACAWADDGYIVDYYYRAYEEYESSEFGLELLEV